MVENRHGESVGHRRDGPLGTLRAVGAAKGLSSLGLWGAGVLSSPLGLGHLWADDAVLGGPTVWGRLEYRIPKNWSTLGEEAPRPVRPPYCFRPLPAPTFCSPPLNEPSFAGPARLLARARGTPAPQRMGKGWGLALVGRLGAGVEIGVPSPCRPCMGRGCRPWPCSGPARGRLGFG